MARETGNKKHKVRMTFIVTAIVTAVATIGGVIATAALGAPLMVLSELCFGVAGLSAVIGTSVGIHRLHEARVTSGSKKASMKNLQKIAENDPSLTKDQRIKIVKKFAKSNLKLCKILGCPLCGKFHSVAGMGHAKKTEALNALENLELLQSLETTQNGRKKWDAKIKSKSVLVAKNCLKSGVNRWSKTYDNFIDGISIYDRRTEIGCLTTKTSAEFERLASIVPNTDEIGASVSISFFKNGRVPNTYARVADPTLVHDVAKIMLKDVYYACEGKSAQEIEAMFPFSIRTHTINKKTSDIENANSKFINTYADLENELGITQEHIR